MDNRYFVSDALASRMGAHSDTINTGLGFEKNVARGAELNDAALLKLVQYPLIEQLCTEITMVKPKSLYLISNFVMLSEKVKNEFIRYGNFILYEHDHKYVQSRNPFTYSPDGIVPVEHKINIDFYQAAIRVICLTDWHAKQVKANTGANVCNIHGSMYTYEELDHLDQIRESTRKRDRYAIFGNRYKNPTEARDYAAKKRLKYNLIQTVSDRERFLKTLACHKGLIFFPRIPETCSRLLIEAKMLGLEIHTNENSGASREHWWPMSGQELTDKFRNSIIPLAVDLFNAMLR